MDAIRLLSLDLDDTLWPCAPTILSAENALYQHLQKHVPTITRHSDILQLRQKRIDFLKRHPEISHDLSAIRIQSLKELAREYALEDDWVDEAFRVFYDARQRVTLFDDVVESLNQLYKQYRLAAVSNGNADIQKTGVGHWFEFSISAAEVGYLKPHPAVFESVLERAGCAASQVLHIGDDHNDILGASRAGIRSVWLNRSEKEWQHQDCVADYEVSSLAELSVLLRDLRP